MMLILILYCQLLLSLVQRIGSVSQSLIVYPNTIPKFHVRKDIATGQPVQSGLLHTLPSKVTLSEFKKHLQCSPTEPNFNHNSGMISLLRLSPPTSDSIKLVCAYIEKRCGEWDECRQHQRRFEDGHYYKGVRFNELNQFSFGQLLRVMNGSLYYDWPWGVDRFDPKVNENTLIPLIKMTLERITDLRDSVFFVSGDQPNIPVRMIMPMFSHSTADSYTDIVWPWYEMWQDANRAYKNIRGANLNFDDDVFYKIEEGYLPWQDKIPKAAYYSTIFRNRQFMYDAARLHPDLFDAKFNGELLPPADMSCLQPWNPSSTEVWDEAMYAEATEEAVAEAQSQPAGYVMSLLNLTTKGRYNGYVPGRYKYVVIPVGAGVGLSTSARLHHILASSGAVVLLQSSSYRYHISAQFKPWVHYVPLTFSGADVAEKVRWLREHDDLARQIAENGRNFARSYLRLEDYYCYAATALDMFAELSSSTDAAKATFSPKPIQPMQIRFGDRAAFEWPI